MDSFHSCAKSCVEISEHLVNDSCKRKYIAAVKSLMAYAYEHDLCRDSLAIVVDPESDVRIFNFLFSFFSILNINNT